MPICYRIEGRHGLNEPFFVTEVAAGALGEGGIETLLQRLAARHLSDGEIVAACKKRSARGYSPLLVVGKPRPTDHTLVWSCGENPYYTATRSEECR